MIVSLVFELKYKDGISMFTKLKIIELPRGVLTSNYIRAAQKFYF